MHFAAVHMHLHLLTGRTHCSLKRGEAVKHNKQQTMLPISVFEFLNIGVKNINNTQLIVKKPNKQCIVYLNATAVQLQYFNL